MKKTLLSSLIIASAFSPLVSATKLPKAGSISTGAQLSFGNIDHDRFKNDQDAAAQVMFYADYYFKPGWAIEVGVNGGENVQDWICENTDTDDGYCINNDDSNEYSFESDLEYSNIILALRLDTQVSVNSFIYGKLGAQYFDYEMSDDDGIFEEESGTGIYSELGWRYQWSNNLSANVGYQHIAMSDLTISSLAVGLSFQF